jgi:tetratricopeptide (TPR) repeat protein
MKPWRHLPHPPTDMNKKLFLGLLCSLISVLPIFANGLDQANQQFKAGDFAGAAAAYEKILTAEGPSAAVFYNLGNSYQQLKQYGPAILAYERARLLTPRDPDLLANLTLARKAATAFDETGYHPWVDLVINRLSRNEWSWLVAGTALFLGALSLVCGVIRLSRRGVPAAAAAALLIIAASSAALFLRRGEAVRGIVLSESATVRLSPFEKAESLGTPGPGRIVRLGAKSGDFQYIEVPGANLQGWLASKDVAPILMDSFVQSGS